MSELVERRKSIMKNEAIFNRSDKFTCLLQTKAQKSFHRTKSSDKYNRTQSAETVYRQVPTRIVKTKYEQAKKAKEKQEQYNQYERTIEKQKKYQASLKFLANQKQQLFLKLISSKCIKKVESPLLRSRLYIEEFNNFQQKRQTSPHNDWQQYLLKVDKKKEQQIKHSKSKKRQPYQRLINKYRALNKQNYNYDNIRGINYCKGIKHQIRRSSSYSHMKSKSQSKIIPTQGSKILKTENPMTSTLMLPTKSIIEMCKDFNCSAVNLKKSMDGFQIYCNRFNNILQKKKAALFIAEI